MGGTTRNGWHPTRNGWHPFQPGAFEQVRMTGWFCAECAHTLLAWRVTRSRAEHNPLVGVHAARREFHQLPSALPLLSLEVFENATKVVTVLFGVCLSDPPNLSNDFVVYVHGCVNSSGVHRIGGRYPSLSHTAPIRARIIAFAICRQFQVSRKSMPLTAAIAIWSASSEAAAATIKSRLRCAAR